jgi:hypothetical protein
LAAVLACTLLLASPVAAADQTLGLGLHYWKSLDDLAKDFPGVEDDGVSWLAAYQYDPAGLFKFEVDLEYFRKGFGGSTGSAWSPQLLVLVGGDFYGGAGITTTFASSFENNRSSTSFLARAGWQITLLPGMHLDVNLNWKADAFNELKDVRSNALTLGVFARFNIAGNKTQ